MYYDIEKNVFEIGERIRNERIAAGYKNQSEFALALGLQEDSRQSVGAWENGERLPKLKTLLKMCELFDCEIGYLLCEHNGKTKEATDISKATGLSNESVQRLFLLRKKSKSKSNPFATDFHINSIVEHEKFIDLILAINKHVWSFNHNHYGIDKTNAEAQDALANTFNCEPEELRGYVEMSSQSLIEKLLMDIVRDIK